jgi:hypothetical protein
MAAKSKPNPAPKPEDNLDTAPLGDTPAAPAMLISISDLMESGKMALKAGTLGVTEASLSLFDQYLAIAGTLPPGLKPIHKDLKALQRKLAP